MQRQKIYAKKTFHKILSFHIEREGKRTCVLHFKD
jgi:hypothetical protein